MKKFKKILSVALSGAILIGISQINAISKSIENEVYLGGDPFGVKFYSKGVVVINLESYFDGEKYVCPAKDDGLKINDIIKEANGQTITSNEDLQQAAMNSNGNEINFKIERNSKEIEKKVKPLKNVSGMYLIGAWVRDSCAGIGTVTFYDKDNKYFAALGHGICDNDTSVLMPLGSGEAVHANINGITKSVCGKAGSLNGYFTDKSIGNLKKNTSCGIYGTINDNIINNDRKIEIAENNEIKIGEAGIYTTISGENPQYYTIKISKIVNMNSGTNENFVIKITDERLMKYCGGIVQGMSGSPIVQNGKLVGAVTHVFLNNPSEGYGVTAQNMVTNYVE